MAAPIVEGAPEDCTLAGGHGRGDRTGDDGGLVEAGVNAVGSAGIDAEVDATTSMTTAKMVARVGRARPAVPLEPQAEPMAPKIVLPTLTALLGWAGPAVPVESTMLLTTLLVPLPMVRRTAPTMPRTMLKVDADMDARFFRCVDAVGVDAGSSPGSGTGLGADVSADAVSVGVSASMWAGVCDGVDTGVRTESNITP